MFIKSDFKTNIHSHITILAIITSAIFLVTTILGEGIGGSLAANPSCYPYLGCTSGFFGYDAIEHLLFGIAGTFVLVWLFKKFPHYSLLNTIRWKNILMFIALIVLISVLWEFLECAHDVFRISILHQPLTNVKLHLNLLDQPSNLDTMGDLFFGLFGSVIAFFFLPKHTLK